MAKEVVPVENEKLKALKLTLEKIDKDYGKGSIMKLGDKEVVEIGNQWAIEQCKELMKADVPVLHFYTMGKSAQTQAICQAIF
jgi:methylenetetrahydrofolate reductase (NADPH)